ncbi:HisA/HisF-related TIM barrel protein [Methylophaga sp.]|uniref:HisA/HisF-related TIM barrel protein n=1 Tax=Methylophaga sp. TaxID=2024840 RepID=UPI003F69A7DC
MQIIPVIDIKGGVVVHAQGGSRGAYPPLKSILTQSNDVIQVMKDIVSWYPFKLFYIADLDAIVKNEHRYDFYQALCQQFPTLEIWLDAGITCESDLVQYGENKNLKLIVGSETLKTLSLLEKESTRQSLILSLDKRHGKMLGDQTIVERPELWTDKSIVMDLDVVGAGKGPSYDWLQKLMAARPDICWYAAGGVRDKKDLEKLEKIKAAGTLIASALHTGNLDKTTLQIMEQKHRPSSEGRCDNKL